MFRFVALFLGAILRLFRRRQSLLLENLLLRQQVSALKRKNPRPKLTRLDRCFWITARRLWSEWKSSLLLVNPKRSWIGHRRGFRIYWRLKSKVGQAGRKLISLEIFDRDAKCGLEVLVAVRGMGIEPLRISWRSPWQNGVAERWGGSCRRELLDHVIPANERSLRRLLTEYVCYHHEDRTHLGLAKQTPNGRVRAEASGRVISCARLGGLHHRYHRAA